MSPSHPCYTSDVPRDYRILVTGSRDWTDRAVLEGALNFEVALGPTLAHDRVVIVHGGARGADVIAGEIAKKRGWEVEVHPANWDAFGKKAGFVRNKQMVDKGADACIGFIKNNSRGASMCVELAEKAGIPTNVYRETSPPSGRMDVGDRAGARKRTGVRFE